MDAQLSPAKSATVEEKDSEWFPVSNGGCTTFPSRRTSSNRSNSLEETLLDRVAIMSANVDFFSFLLV